MQYLGTKWGKPEVQDCIEPEHFSLQVTEHNNAVLICFLLHHKSQANSVARTNCR